MSFAIQTSPASDFQVDDVVVAGRIGQGEDQPISETIQGVEESRPDGADIGQQVSGETIEGETLPPVAIEATPTDDDDDSADADWWAEIELIGKLSEVEKKRQLAVAELEEITEARKEAKKLVDGLNVELQRIASEIVKISQGKTFPAPAKPVVTTEAATTITEAQAVTTEATESTAWRDVPTATLLDGVQGLGKKKLETLVDIAPTAGALEDLRATSNGVFKSVLPKGFGDKVASAIEDALLNCQTNHDTPPASEQVKQNKLAEQAVEPMKESTTLADDELRTEIERQAELFRAEAVDDDWPLEVCDPEANDDVDEIVIGFNAFNDGKDLYACPFKLDDRHTIELWVNGWVYGERRKFLLSQQKPSNATDDLMDI